MSLLWVQAAWWEDRPGSQEWDEYGYGHETKAERVERHLSHIQQVHGVDRDTALRAARFAQDDQLSPVKAGFASEPSQRNAEPPAGSETHGIWASAPVEDVDLSRPVHASQNWLKRGEMFHNLFHPGKKPAMGDYQGHPDQDPDWDMDDENDSSYWDHSDAGHPLDLPRMIRQTDGSYVVHDGHHRVATHLLLGKPTVRARVRDVRSFRTEKP